MGATPIRAATCLLSSVPSSGISISKLRAPAWPITGYADEDIEACLQVFVGNYPGHQFVFNGFKMSAYLFEACRILLLEQS